MQPDRRHPADGVRGSITSDEPTEEVLRSADAAGAGAAFGQRHLAVGRLYPGPVGWYDNATINLGINGRIAHLFPGQKLELHRAQHPHSDYRDFAAHLLRELARCMGLTYESATADYTNATYSSVRMASGEIFQITLYRRAHILALLHCRLRSLARGRDRGRHPFPVASTASSPTVGSVRAIWRGRRSRRRMISRWPRPTRSGAGSAS
jgi:hypothetical protein